MMPSRLARLGLFSTLLIGLLAIDVSASAQNLGTPRVRQDIHGNIVQTGNTALTCQPGSTAGGVSCANAQSNRALNARDNDYPMVFVDADNGAGVAGANTTTQSSAASLSLPATGSVKWAGLYWMCQGTSATRNQVSFQAPGTGAYSTLTATQLMTGGNGNGYLGYADVTTRVRNAGAGTYWVGNMQCNTGMNTWGGWNLIVIYEDLNEPLRDLVVWDGNQSYQNAPGISLNLTGFVTPFSSLVNRVTDVGIFLGDGDLGQNDTLTLVGGTGGTAITTNLADTVSNNATDIGNSTISTPYLPAQTMIPSYANTLGIDLDVMRLTNRLPTGAQQATINALGSAQDVLWIGTITFSTNIYAPDLVSTKTAVDVNGGQLLPGDELEYTINFVNNGLDAALNTQLVDNLPAYTTLSSASNAITIDGVALTPAVDTDAGAYSAAQNRVTIAIDPPIGRVDTNESHVATIRVVLANNIPSGTLLQNQAQFVYNGETLGNAVSYNSLSDGSSTSAGNNPTDTPIVTPPVLAFTETVSLTNDLNGLGDFDPGDTLTFTVTLTNISGDTAQAVQLSDVFDLSTLELINIATTAGTVSSNTAPNLAVNVGNLAAGQSAVVTLTARIRRPFPVGVTSLSDQWAASYTGYPSIFSDDPSVGGTADPTVVSPITGTCACLVGSTCYASGEGDPANGCGVCDPATSQTSFSAVVDGNSCSAGSSSGTCHGGSCCTTCWNGAACVPGPTTCGVVCGDGQRVAGEECDDGNLTAGDGCDATCGVEGGFSCAGALPNVCTADVTISTPTNGSSTSDTTPTISGTGPADSMLTVSEGATVLCTTTVSPAGTWSCDSVALALGAHVIVATTSGPGAGDLGRSLPDSFTIIDTCGDGTVATGETCDDGNTTSGDGCSNSCAVEAGYSCAGAGPSVCTAGVIAITSPANGSTTTDTTPDIAGTAKPNSTVTVFEGTTQLCTTTANASGAWSCTSSTLVLGGHTVFARSAGPNAGDNGLSLDDTFTITAPITQLRPVILVPADGGTVSTQRPLILGRGEPNALITVLEGSMTVCTASVDPSGTWSCTPNTDLAIGAHQIVASQWKDTVTLVSLPVDFTIDLGALASPTLVTPPPGSVINVTRPTLSGTAAPGSTVTVSEGGTTICSGVTSASGIWSCVPTSPLAEGPHPFDLTSTLGGRTSNGGPDVITVDLTAPTIDIVLPASGTVTSDSTPEISGTTEANAKVKVYEAGTLLCSTTADAAGAWSCSPTTALSEGLHSVHATATDAAGNVSAPDVTDFIVDTTGPSVLITGPSEGAILRTGTPTLVGTSEPGATVVVTEGTTVVCTASTDASGTWSCVPTSPLAQGPHPVTATATDGAGNAGPTDTQSFSIDSTAISTPVLTGPLKPVMNPMPVLTGTSDPNVTVTVSLAGGGTVCVAVADASGNWSCTPTSPLADGPNDLVLVATDGVDTSAPGTGTVTVDTTAPLAPLIVRPGSTPTSNTRPTIGGTAEPNTTVTVRGPTGDVICTARVDAAGNWACVPTSSLPEGSTAITATSTDDAGNESTPANGVVNVDTTAPTISIATPVNGSTIRERTPTVSGSTEPLAHVLVTDDAGFFVCSTTADASGNWSCLVPSALVDGPHTLRATATDEAGNASTPASTVFIVDTTEPETGGGLSGGALCSVGVGEGSAAAPALLGLAAVLLGLRRARRRNGGSR